MADEPKAKKSADFKPLPEFSSMAELVAHVSKTKFADRNPLALAIAIDRLVDKAK